MAALLFDWRELACFHAFAIAKRDFLFRLGRLLPTALIVGLVKVNKEERMQEIHECVSLIQFVVAIDWQIHVIIGAFMRLIDLGLKLLLGVLVRYVAHHHISTLLVARDHSLDRLVID